MSESLEHRIWKLEQIETIRRLKARYWRCCDHKDVPGVRDCFYDGPIEVDYDGTGKHTHRDAFYALFEKFSLRDNIVEHHHGGGGDIEILDETSARAHWSLSYRLMDTKARTLFTVGGYYDDEYLLHEGQWVIRKSTYRVRSVIGHRWDDNGQWKVIHAGAKLLSGPVPQGQA